MAIVSAIIKTIPYGMVLRKANAQPAANELSRLPYMQISPLCRARGMKIPAHHVLKHGMLDQFLPRWTFGHRHKIVVESGDIAAIYAIARSLNMAKSSLIPRLLRLRGLPVDHLDVLAFSAAMGWTEMVQIPASEFIIGYWRGRRIEPVLSQAQFLHDTPGATQKVAFSFRFRRLGPNQVEIDTETRVLCIGRYSKWTYSMYWLAIKPFSGLIREEILKIIKREAEARVGRLPHESGQ